MGGLAGDMASETGQGWVIRRPAYHTKKHL